MPFRAPVPDHPKSLFRSDLDFLKKLVDQMPVAIGIAALAQESGGEIVKPEARILYYNQKWRDTFGFGLADVPTADEATRRMYPDPEQRAENYRLRNEAAQKSRASGKPAEPLRMRARVADGTSRTFLTGTTVIEDLMVVSMEDITAMEQLTSPSVGEETKSERVALSRTGSTEIFIALNSIAAVEADRKYSRVLSGSSWFPDGRNIATWEEFLKGQGFERLDRSTLVRTGWIHGVQSYGRGARISFAHAAVSLDVGRVGRERLMRILKKKD